VIHILIKTVDVTNSGLIHILIRAEHWLFRTPAAQYAPRAHFSRRIGGEGRGGGGGGEEHRHRGSGSTQGGRRRTQVSSGAQKQGGGGLASLRFVADFTCVCVFCKCFCSRRGRALCRGCHEPRAESIAELCFVCVSERYCYYYWYSIYYVSCIYICIYTCIYICI